MDHFFLFTFQYQGYRRDSRAKKKKNNTFLDLFIKKKHFSVFVIKHLILVANHALGPWKNDRA